MILPPNLSIKRLYPLACLILMVILLLTPMFYNGFPILYRDTYHYLNSSISLHHPIYYSLILAPVATSILKTIYILPIAHSFILIFLLRFFYNHQQVSCGIVWPMSLIILPFSTLPYLTSTIMPDFFWGIGSLTLYLFIFKFNEISQNLKQLIFLSTLFIFAMIVHNTHWSILLTTFAIAFPFKINLL